MMYLHTGELDACIVGGKRPSYVNSQALGMVENDTIEAVNHMEIFGESVAITSIKGVTGHTFGASAGMQIISSPLLSEWSVTSFHLLYMLYRMIIRVYLSYIVQFKRRLIALLSLLTVMAEIMHVFLFPGMNAKILCLMENGNG